LHPLGHVACHHRSRTIDGMIANRHTAQYDRAHTNVGAFSNRDGAGNVGSWRERHVVVNGCVVSDEHAAIDDPVTAE